MKRAQDNASCHVGYSLGVAKKNQLGEEQMTSQGEEIFLGRAPRFQ